MSLSTAEELVRRGCLILLEATALFPAAVPQPDQHLFIYLFILKNGD